MTEYSAIVDQFGVYTYKSPLIMFRSENFTDWRHRELAMKEDPFVNAYICKLDEEIFTDLPVFEPDLLHKEIDDGVPNPDYDESMLKDWINEGWTDLMIDIFNSARTHSFCIPTLYDREPYWKVFTFRELTKITYNKYGVPISAVAEWQQNLPLAEEPKDFKETLNFNRNTDGTSDFNSLFVPFGTPKGKHLGVYDLESIWDLSIYARYQVLDMVNNSAKTSGFFHFVYGNAMKTDAKQDLIDAIDYTGVGQAIGAKKNVLEEINFHYPEHPEFTVEALVKTINMIAGNTRLPFSFYYGEKETGGVFQEGFSDEAKITKKKNYIFSQFKKYIIELVRMRWGKIVTDVKPYIEEQMKQDQQFENDQEQHFEQDHFNNNPNSIRSKI